MSNKKLAQQAQASGASTTTTSGILFPGIYNIQTSNWTSSAPAKVDMGIFSDEEIMEEYLKRFSPLAKAMSENE